MSASYIRGKPHQLSQPARGCNVYLTGDMIEWLGERAESSQLSVSSLIRTILHDAMRAEREANHHV
ncbi:hypothetical protein ABGN05_20015 [Aquibium sp. LZ166]|uniref:CopG family transcriptional regulator n=1 Tax=Aquibium pacificus TaxID=3153579 RepID=A0ABV3SP16_9HYPH